MQTIDAFIIDRDKANKEAIDRLKELALSGNETAMSRLSALKEFHVSGKARQPGWYLRYPWFDPDNLSV